MHFSKMLHCLIKKGSMRSGSTLIVGALLLVSSNVYSQSTLYMQGAQVSTMQGALVYVNGGVTATGSTLLHNGTLQLTGDWTNSDIADSVFDPSSTGLVILSQGQQQTIGGYTTTFPNLTLGTDSTVGNTTLLTANTLVNNVLSLNNNELDVNGKDMFVRSSSSQAIARIPNTNGHVNTTNNPNGRLLQAVSANTQYVFPLGGGKGMYRYRPLTVNTLNDGVLATQFQNYDPNNDGYNRNNMIGNFNDINPNFYHTIGFVNGTTGSASVALAYNSIDDGTYNALVEWKYYDHWELANNYQNVTVAGEGTDQSMNYTLVDTGKNVIALAHYIDNNNLYIVNAFSPNHDNKNDFFVIKGLENYRYNEVKVYNRWGNLLMSEHNYQNDWQGNNLDIGTYMYTLKVVDAAGVEHFYKGDVTVVK